MLKYFYLVQYYFLKYLPVKVIRVGYFNLIYLYWYMVMMKIQFYVPDNNKKKMLKSIKIF